MKTKYTITFNSSILKNIAFNTSYKSSSYSHIHNIHFIPINIFNSSKVILKKILNSNKSYVEFKLRNAFLKKFLLFM